MTLTHRERVRAVLSGERPDRPVVDLGGFVNTFTRESYLEFKAHLGYGSDLAEETITMINTVSKLDDRVLEHFDIPFRRICPGAASSFRYEYAADGSFQDEWGITLRPMGSYYAREGSPLKHATIDDLDGYPWPDPDDPARYEGLANEARRLYEGGDYSLVGASIWSGPFQQCWYLRGMQQFLEDMLLEPEFAIALLDRTISTQIRLYENFLDAVGEYLDVVETYDDLGAQTGPLISPRLYREIVKPAHARLFAAIHARTRAKIFFHSCGAVMPFIDDMVEIGVDILNPIQPLPGLMDPEELKTRWGERLVFHGGLDVQQLLYQGTPGEVGAFIRRYLDVLGPERYIMSPTCPVLPGTPAENVAAAFDAAASYTREQ